MVYGVTRLGGQARGWREGAERNGRRGQVGPFPQLKNPETARKKRWAARAVVRPRAASHEEEDEARVLSGSSFSSSISSSFSLSSLSLASTSTSSSSRTRTSSARVRVQQPETDDLVVVTDDSPDSLLGDTDAATSTSISADADEDEPKTLWGAMALIIGSTIGAGILALPDISQDAGFVASTGGLVGVWAFLVAQALLLAEVNINIYWADKPNCTLVSSSDDEDAGTPFKLTEAVVVCDRRGDRELLDGFRGFVVGGEFGGDSATAKNSNMNMTTLRAMAERTLGKNVGRLTTTIYLSLSYCLLVAYLSKVAEMFSFVTDGAVNADLVVVEFVAASLALFSFGGQKATDTLNQWLTFSLVGSFISILGIGIWTELSSGRQIDSLIHVSGAELMHLPPALPIMFLSLVYHDLIPFICSYLNGTSS